MYFLDSCTCIDLMRGKLPHTYDLMRANSPKLFAIPAIVEAELRVGAEKSAHPRENRLLLERFLAPYAIVPFDSTCAAAYGRIRANLESRGLSIGGNDMLIAATAITHEAVLVTGNVREFQRVPRLSIECWDEIEF
ncbi:MULTISPECIES: type II toxin-antitoxin system VapC family toxin [unclassified Adlercreutzia]|uniref:type II toxin-antitoxin system VapC family toxin n=1 Tax=unclassified Adlercreutzia TaxID=2636013 RepID=UPI0013EC01A0|nr:MULTISPECIES: type II toxin-antitoxin system VapC family toxin [unclassified Adlercreutzia]